MDPKLFRILGAFSVFFSLAIPAFGALIASATYTPLVNLLQRAGGSATSPLANLYFNHFRLALAFPLAVAVVAALFAFLAWRKKETEPAVPLARLLVIQTFAAFASFLWLGAFVVAAVQG